MNKKFIMCILYITMILNITACGKTPKAQEPHNGLMTVSGQLQTTAAAMPEFKVETEKRTVGSLPLPEGWTEFVTGAVSDRCSRLYSETGLAAIVMVNFTSSNEAVFGDITNMETYVGSRMSSGCVLKSTEQIESEYGNILNRIVVGAGDSQEAEELHYIVLSADGGVTVDIVVIDENYTVELEKYAAHISIR